MANFKYTGAQSLLLLHEKYMHLFVATWKEADKLSIKLPETTDPAYESLYHLLWHPLKSCGGYLTWICDKLKLPDPQIDVIPPVESIAEEADKYLEHILERWQLPLVDVEEERFYRPVFKSRWDVEYCIDAMLEHAVMHPLRHEFQLRKLIDEQILPIDP